MAALAPARANRAVRSAREELLSDPPPVRRAALWAFPLALLLVSTFAFFGDTGKWNDDWWFFGQRVPETGELRTLGFDREVHYWRPLYRFVHTPLMAVTFSHDWIVHALCTLAHGLAALAVFRLARALGVGVPAATLAGVGFMVHPAGFEASLWMTALPTTLATAMMLELVRAVVRRAREGRRGRWWHAPLGAGVAFAAASLNEQPAMLAPGAVLAAVLFARLRGRRAGPGELESPAVSRAWSVPGLGAAVGACAGLAAYVGIVMTRFPAPVEKGAIGAALPIGDWPERLVVLLKDFLSQFTLSAFGPGALAQAARAAGEYPLTAAGWAALLVLTAIAWRRHFARAVDAEPHARTGAPAGAAPAFPTGATLLFALALFLLLWLPMVRIVYPSFQRLSYAPLSVAAVGAAAILQPLFARLAPRTLRVGLSAFAVLAIAQAIVYVGIQDAYRERFRADLVLAQSLRRALPQPPPGAVFVPVRLSDRPITTGAKNFDNYFGGALLLDWSSPWFVKWTYRRSDLSAVRGSVLRRPPMRLRDDGTLAMYGRPLPLETIIPLEIGPAGDVVIFTEVVVRRAGGGGGGERRLALPTAARAAEMSGIRPRPLVISNRRADN